MKQWRHGGNAGRAAMAAALALMTSCATCPPQFAWGIGPYDIPEFPVSMGELLQLSQADSFRTVMQELGPAPSGLPASRRRGLFLTPDDYYVADVRYVGAPTHTVVINMPGSGVGPCYPTRRMLELMDTTPARPSKAGEAIRHKVERGEVHTYFQGSTDYGGCLERITFTSEHGGAAEN